MEDRLGPLQVVFSVFINTRVILTTTLSVINCHKKLIFMQEASPRSVHICRRQEAATARVVEATTSYMQEEMAGRVAEQLIVARYIELSFKIYCTYNIFFKSLLFKYAL